MSFRKLWVVPAVVCTVSLGLLVGCGSKEPASKAKIEIPKSPVDMSSVGSVSGKVSFEGTVPKMEKIEMSADAACSKQHKTKIEAGDLLVKSGKVKNVIVHIQEGLAAWSFPAGTGKATLDQMGCLYNPHVQAFQVGDGLEIKNSDNTLHNIHALSGDTSLFNLGMPTKGMKIDQSLTTLGINTIKCDVHSWMKCYIGIFDHPCFAVTGTDGSFTIKNLPAGTYTLRAWHERLGIQDQSITVGAKEEKKVNFSFKL